MRRVNLYIPEPDVAQLMKLRKKWDVSVAELIRRAIHLFLKEEGKDGNHRHHGRSRR